GFARAARLLHLAQPALSKQIHDLETELGVALFERIPRGVRLTRAGEAFFTEARNTLDGAARAIASARGASEDRASTLHFAHGELSLYAATIEALAAQPSVRLPDLQALPWLQSASLRWPGFLQVFEEALQDRGLRPQRRRERPKEAPSHNLLIAAGEAWALASEAIAAPYRTGSQA